MRLRLRSEICTLSAVLIACSVYDESLLVDGDDTFEDGTPTSSSGSGGQGPSAGSLTSSSTSQGSNTTSSTSGTGTTGSTEAGGTGGTSGGSQASSTSQGGENTSSNNGGGGGDTTTSASSGGGSASTSDGTTGSGGSNGSGGTSGTGGTGGAVAADPLLIDDLDDADGRLDPNYTGYWYFAMDEEDPDAEGEITAPDDTDTPRGVETTPAREGSTHAMHAAGSWGGWGAALGFSFNQPDTKPIDGSVFSGISFYARASAATTARLEVVTDATYDKNNHLRAELSLTNEWEYHEVLWRDLEEPDWDPDAPWEPETMLKVQFHFDNSDFDFWIDDVRFVE